MASDGATRMTEEEKVGYGIGYAKGYHDGKEFAARKIRRDLPDDPINSKLAWSMVAIEFMMALAIFLDYFHIAILK